MNLRAPNHSSAAAMSLALRASASLLQQTRAEGKVDGVEETQVHTAEGYVNNGLDDMYTHPHDALTDAQCLAAVQFMS